MVLSTVGDAATTLVGNALLELRRPAHSPFVGGRVVRSKTALGTYDAVNARNQSYLIRVWSIGEAYTDVVLESRFRARLPAGSAEAMSLMQEHLAKASMTWDGRKASFADHHGIVLSDFGGWVQIKGLQEARNSIAHGLGRLTRKQLGNPLGAAASCAQIDVRVHAAELIVPDGAVVKAADAVDGYIRWLDPQIP